jgi:hypothetical protein
MGGAVQVSRIAPLIAVTAIGCSPYDPQLGAHPFLCANTRPRCPDGYVCVPGEGSAELCALPASVPDGGGTTGDSGLQCGVDSDREPNDTIATPTLITETGGTTPIDAVLCPETDVDIYQLNVDTTGESIRVDVIYNEANGPLAIDLLNSTGLVIRSATRVDNDPGHLRVDFENLASSAYYARVQPMDTAFRTNYQVTFLVTAGPLPP